MKLGTLIKRCQVFIPLMTITIFGCAVQELLDALDNITHCLTLLLCLGCQTFEQITLPRGMLIHVQAFLSKLGTGQHRA